jgi:secreted Zn-dependent insulinase-like peptidase
MLLLGTEKYPEKYEYENFLTENGGSDIATTYPCHTVYEFDVGPKVLEEALDRCNTSK